jgi:uncharacterized protein
MPKVVLDSSILVSAFITPHGEVKKLLVEPFRSQYTLYLSEEILSKTARILLLKPALRRYTSYTDDEVRAYLSALLSEAVMVDDLPELKAVPDDPNDDIIIATAVKAEANYLITGDQHMLGLGSYQNTTILSARAFIEYVQQAAQAA